MSIRKLKTPFGLAIICTLGLSCSGVKKLPATIAGASRAKLVATWTLTNIRYDGLLPGAVQTLFEQPLPDLTGSIWQLTNSGNGSYLLANGTRQTIFWSYQSCNNAPIFQFKKLYQGDSARKVQEGYQLLIASIDEQHLTLESPVALGDKTACILLDFNKAH